MAIDTGMVETETVTASPDPPAAGGSMMGAGVAGSVLGTMVSLYEGSRQRDFERYMSGTAYQRAVADMRRAGLNPMMMFKGGAGPASTPSVTRGDPAGNLGRDITASMMAKSTLELQDSQKRAADASAYKARSEASLTNTIGQIRAETMADEIAAIRAGAQSEVTAAKRAAAMLEGEVGYEQGFYRSLQSLGQGKWGDIDWSNLIMHLISSGASSAADVARRRAGRR